MVLAAIPLFFCTCDPNAIGDNGCRIVVSLFHEREKRGLKPGLTDLCGGVLGQAAIVGRDF